MPRKLRCKVCKCSGIHRGCTRQDRPPLWNGATIPSEYVYGEADRGCPCIKADNTRIQEEQEAERARIQQVKEAQRAVENEELSLRKRITAIEKVLWGRSFEGETALRRPKLLDSKKKHTEEPARKRARKSS